MAPGQDHTLHHTSWNQGWTGFHHQPLGHPATLVSIHWSPRVPSSTAPRSGSRDGGSCQHLTLRQKGRVRHSQLEGGSQPSAHQGEGQSHSTDEETEAKSQSNLLKATLQAGTGQELAFPREWG